LAISFLFNIAFVADTSAFHQRRITLTSPEIHYTLITIIKSVENNMYIILQIQQKFGRFQVDRGCHGRDRMVVGCIM